MIELIVQSFMQSPLYSPKCPIHSAMNLRDCIVFDCTINYKGAWKATLVFDCATIDFEQDKINITGDIPMGAMSRLHEKSKSQMTADEKHFVDNQAAIIERSKKRRETESRNFGSWEQTLQFVGQNPTKPGNYVVLDTTCETVNLAHVWYDMSDNELIVTFPGESKGMRLKDLGNDCRWFFVPKPDDAEWKFVRRLPLEEPTDGTKDQSS